MGSFWWVITGDPQEVYFDSLKLNSRIPQTHIPKSEQEALEYSVPLDFLTVMLYKLHFYIII